MRYLPSAYLFYGMQVPEKDVHGWLIAADDEETTLIDVLDDEVRFVKKEFGCELRTGGGEYDRVLILAARLAVIGPPRENEKPVAFQVSYDFVPVKVKPYKFVGWDNALKEAADYLKWPEDKREIGWWLMASY